MRGRMNLNCIAFMCLMMLLNNFHRSYGFFLKRPLLSTKKSVASQTTFLRMASTAETRLSNNERLNDFLKEIKEIVSTPGIGFIGMQRSFQIARGIGRLANEYSKNKNLFLDRNGRFSAPKAMRKLFEEMGATYVKLGQFIASSPTLFPAEYVEEFQACLDKTPTVPYDVIRRIIESDLKKPISSVYASVDPVPIASASIAQVHKAKLKDGTDVAIKVRKPGVDATLQADLAFLLISSKLIELINPSVSSLSLANIVSDIRDSMLDELDFRKEANNLLNFREFLLKNDIDDATAPKPFMDASGVRVLTMEYLKGVPLVDLEGIRRFTAQPEATLISALRTWSLSVAVNDIFHADVHAGNLLVLQDGKIGFIDFGIGKMFPT